MDKFTHFESVVGKSFGFNYWKNVYTNDDIKNHANNLRLSHLKHAVNFNLITTDEYFAYRLRLTEHCRPCGTHYKPSTLMDFGKMLKTSNMLFKSQINHNNSPSENEKVKVQSSVMDVSANEDQQKQSVINLQKYYRIKESEGQTKKQKKSKKKKKRKKLNTILINNDNYVNYTKNEVEVELYEKNNYTVSKSKESVKIFIRQAKTYNNETIHNESTKKSVRDVFSKILKQYKQKKQTNV